MPPARTQQQRQHQQTAQQKEHPHRNVHESEQKNNAAEAKKLPPPPPPPKKKSKGIMGLLEGIVPGALYNRDSKKIFGILSAEDLLLIALIFMFADSGDEDGNLVCLALIYVLLSDYIDLSDYF